MAFRKTAKALVQHPGVQAPEWMRWRQHLQSQGRARVASTLNLAQQASDILGEKFDPSKYLLTHVTIVSSVDTEDVANVKLGSVEEYGRTINRKWADYHITTDTEKFTNNNHDAFSRGVLLKSYRTFVGGHNFVEHVQLVEQSKGRLLDAVARDLGPSIYVDLLVATHRKHADLVRQIESGELSTLSMGCFLPDAQVTLGDGRRVSIKDVQPGDLVRTHVGINREVMHKHALLGSWAMRRLHVRGINDPIESTSNHPIFVMRPQETCSCGCGEELDARRHIDPSRRLGTRFRKGHDKRVFNPNNTYSLAEFKARQEHKHELQKIKLEEVRADEVRPGDLLCYPKTPAQGLGGSKNEARLLGYFLAEGSYIKHKGKRTAVEFNFSLSEKDTYVAEVVELLREVFPDSSPWVQERADRTICMVHASGEEIASWFFLHCGEYSHGKHISAEVMENWSQENLLHLAGAWLNGDGGLARYGSVSRRVSGSTISYELACQLHSILMGGGVYCSLRVRERAKATTVKALINGGSFALRNEETGRYPAYSIDIVQGFGQKLAGYTDKVPTAPAKMKQANELGDFYVFEVEQVEDYRQEGWVYDLTVEEVHSYLVDGIAVHNCTCGHTTCTKCGNVAYDEVQLCDCIRYAKGNSFFDNTGQQRRIAELCGHVSEDPTGGVNFIESSWVKVPAFPGAVMRGVIEPAQLSPKSVKQMKAVLEAPPKEWAKDAPQKAAKTLRTRDPWIAEQNARHQAWLRQQGVSTEHLPKIAYMMPHEVGEIEPQDGQVVARVRATSGTKASGGGYHEAQQAVQALGLPSLRDVASRTESLKTRAAKLARIEAQKDSLRKIGFTDETLDLMVRAEEDEFDFGDEPTDGEPAPAPEEPEEDELTNLVKDTEQEILKRVKKQLKDQIKPKEVLPSVEEGAPSTSNNVIKDGARQDQYLAGLSAIVSVSKTSHELLDNVFRYHEACGRPLPTRLYRAATRAVASSQPFTKACVRALGRQPSEGDLRIITRLGRLLDLRTP